MSFSANITLLHLLPACMQAAMAWVGNPKSFFAGSSKARDVCGGQNNERVMLFTLWTPAAVHQRALHGDDHQAAASSSAAGGEMESSRRRVAAGYTHACTHPNFPRSFSHYTLIIVQNVSIAWKTPHWAWPPCRKDQISHGIMLCHCRCKARCLQYYFHIWHHGQSCKIWK